jgi:hypothetical protein
MVHKMAPYLVLPTARRQVHLARKRSRASITPLVVFGKDEQLFSASMLLLV